MKKVTISSASYKKAKVAEFKSDVAYHKKEIKTLEKQKAKVEQELDAVIAVLETAKKQKVLNGSSTKDFLADKVRELKDDVMDYNEEIKDHKQWLKESEKDLIAYKNAKVAGENEKPDLRECCRFCGAEKQQE